jgi:hypothetical protein
VSMPEIKIHLRRSNFFTTLLFFVVLGSVIVILNLPVFWWMKLILVFFVLMYGGKIFLNQREILGFSFDEKGWNLLLREGKISVLLANDSTVTRWVSVLRFSVEGKWLKKSCLVWWDSVSRDEYRKLIVAARWMKVDAEDASVILSVPVIPAKAGIHLD